MKRSVLTFLIVVNFITVGFAKKSPTSSDGTFSFGVVGDIQVDDEIDLGYAVRSLFTELQSPKPWSFAFFMGDLVNNKPGLFPSMLAQLQQLPFPYRSVIGNHDHNTDGVSIRTDSFDRYFGTSTYAFSQGKVLFLVLNNMVPKGKFGYEGWYDRHQLEFVSEELKKLPKDRLVVIAQHIPLMMTENPDSLKALLRGRNVLMLSAHTHTVSRYQHPLEGGSLQELVVGAACGCWWTGENDVYGIPLALMNCGSPRNYFEVEVQGTQYRIRYKGIGLDANQQMSIWVAGQDTLDRQVPALDSIAPGTVLANVYGGFEQTKVWMQLDDDKPVLMDNIRRVDPMVARIIAFNKAGVYPTRLSRRHPLRNRPSEHLWQARIPAGKVWHRLYIFAEDAYGFSAKGYYLNSK